MGNFFGKKESKESKDDDAPKQYSWDKREAVDPNDFKFSGRKNEQLFKEFGKIDGNDFSIIDCTDCDIYLFDYSAVVTIDKCTNCTFFIGPIKGSVFIRTSTNCKFIVACQQFRTRDCLNVDVLLACNTLPIIESTENIRFGCFRGNHRMLRGHFGQAGLSLFNNYWYEIHDFTKAEDGINYSFFSEKPAWVEEFLNRRPEELQTESVDANEATGCVPVTTRPVTVANSHLLVVFSPTHAKKTLELLYRVQDLKPDGPQVKISRTFEVSITPEGATTLFSGPKSETLIKQASKKSAIGMEIYGEGCEALVHAAIVSLGDDIPLFTTNSENIIKGFFAQTANKMTL